ncbi:MAG: hypothetical protein RR091_10110 [Cloacibacillus sp.]
MERALLLFEDKFPCWDEETFVLAGENLLLLGKLEAAGLLARAGGGYVLTKAGEKLRRKTAEQSCLPASDIGPFVPEEALWRNRLYLLMEHAFIGQYGIKEYTVDERFPVIPALARDELWVRENGTVSYIWQEHPLVRSLIERFPKWGVAARGCAAPGQAALDDWARESGAFTQELRFDLMLRSRYDFDLYRKSQQEPTDRFKLKDADRLFFHRARSTNETLDLIGRLHLFLLANRRVYIPGYADIDSQQQENWTMLVLATDGEKELEETASVLRGFGSALIDPARPLFIVGTSIERLRMQNRPEYTVYDWFCDRTVHIARPDNA